MKTELVTYACASCANVFDASSLGEGAYGEFLLWSKSGQVAYLNAFEDSTYKEVSNFLERNPKTHGLQPLEKAKILRHIYGGVACDPDENGLPFEIDALPPCQKCGFQKMLSWTFKNPPEIVEVPIPSVTHIRWNSLIASEKKDLVETACRKCQDLLRPELVEDPDRL